MILRGILVTTGRFFHLGVLNISPVFILGFSSTLGMTLRRFLKNSSFKRKVCVDWLRMKHWEVMRNRATDVNWNSMSFL